MFRPFLYTLLLLPIASFAATRTASFQVSLTIQESCRVERHEHESAPPQVECVFASPYRVQQATDDKPPAPSQTRLTPSRWEVIF